MGSKSRSRAGIQTCHRTGCASKEGKYCNCRPTYRAEIWSPRDEKKIRKTFSSLAQASAWRSDALAELRRGALRAPTAVTLAQAAEAWLAGASDGSIRNRSGDVYKPSAIRGYEQALRIRVLPALGKARLAELQRGQLQELIDRLLREGHQPSTIRNTLLPLRAIVRRAIARGEIAVNPTSGLELPAVRGTRDRIARPRGGGGAARGARKRPRDLGDRDARLRREIGELRAELAIAYGQRREAEIRQPAASAAGRHEVATAPVQPARVSERTHRR